KGTFTVDEGLRTLLRGSGLEFTVTGSRVVISRTKANHEGPPASPTSAASTLRGDNQAQAAAESEKPAQLEEMTVTGSRIRGAPPASPVTTLTREDMEHGGYADLGDAARSIPQNFGGGVNPGIAGGGNQGGANNLNNSSALDLR